MYERISKTFHVRIFTDRGDRPRYTKYLYTFPVLRPYRQINWFQGYKKTVNKKRKLFLGISPASSNIHALPLAHQLGHGILTMFPFDRRSTRISSENNNVILHIPIGLPYLLGAAHWCTNTVHIKPFSTSVFKVLIWIVATTTKICTIDCFNRAHALICVTINTPSYSLYHTPLV